MADEKSIISETSSFEHPGVGIFDDTEDFELQQRLEKFEREIVDLTTENTLFEAVLERKKSEPIVHRFSIEAPSQANSSQTVTPSVSHQDLTNPNGTNRAERSVRKRSKSRSTQADFRIQLTLEQKVDIAIAEYEQIKNEKARYETTNEKRIDQFQADLEWIDNEMADFELASGDFLKTRDASIDKRTNKLIGEKIDRYFNERLKARESLINKLRDRSSGYKRQIIRLDNEMRQNEEMGDTLHEVDFNQLKIENKQYLDKIDEKNLELVLLKQQVAKFTKIFNHYKDDLFMKTQDLVDTQKRIDKQQALYEHIQRELNTVNYDQTRASRKHLNLVEQTENYRVPEIIDYVRKKALLCNLQRDCEVWQRKVELVSMGLQQSKQKWQTLQRTVRYSHRTGHWNNEL